MTEFEYMKRIQEECISSDSCDGCPDCMATSYGMDCCYKIKGRDYPYNWNLKDLERVLKED